MNIFFGWLSLLSVFATVPDSAGWVEVERPARANSFERSGDEDDADIWVIFSKRLGADNFMVRFPEDPVYVYSDSESAEMEIFASKDGETHRLIVLKTKEANVLERRIREIALMPDILLIETSQMSSKEGEILYRKEGKWVRERLKATPNHLYIIQTKTSDFQSRSHSYFAESFNVRF